MFIVFEGVDGSGKDTQLEKACSYLRSKDKYMQIWITREPTNVTRAGREINARLLGKGFVDGKEALDLYVADRKEQSEIRRNISQHSTILLSRFDYSTYAYQGAQGMSFDDIYAAHQPYTDIFLPDVTFLFDVSIDTSMQRLSLRGGKQEVFEKRSFLETVATKYREAYERLRHERTIYCIDANGSIDEVHDQVRSYL